MYPAKSLQQQIKEITEKDITRNAMRAELVKLKLTPFDIAVILDSMPQRVRANAAAVTFKDLTFGVEIECVNCERRSLINAARANSLDVRSEGYNHTDNDHYIKIVSDSSISGENPNEVVTHILNGAAGIKTVNALCQSLDAVGATVNKSCGLHVHFGCKKMTDEWYVNIFANYKACKKVIDTFLAPSRRGEDSRWCHGLARFDFASCRTAGDVYRMMGGRYYCVNPEAWARHKTIEFRQHQGSVNAEKIEKWVKFLAALILYSREHRIDREVTSIDGLPFATKTMKAYLNKRKNELNR